MKPKLKMIFTLIVAAILFGASLPISANESEREFKVMTYNMYLGADFLDIFTSQDGNQLVAEVAEAYTDVGAGNPQERIAEIADQIAAHDPDIVGLQEVALWRIGEPFRPDLNAEFAVYDFLQILLDALNDRGKSYAAISVLEGFDRELPAVFGPTSALDVRYTDRVVIIARTDLPVSQLKIENTSSGVFQALVPVSLLGSQFVIPRGWTSADIKHRGKTYRFVNTHLESFSEFVQNIQAFELLLGPTDTSLPVILVGDLNSDASAGGVSYGTVIGGGFADVWSLTNPNEAGFTWPLSGEIPSQITAPNQRLDLIFTRGAVSSTASEVVGEELADITQSGLRPSDHAGVVATVVLEP